MSTSAATPNFVKVADGFPHSQGISWMHNVRAIVTAVYRWTHLQVASLVSKRASKRLSVAETISLGEKRLVSILSVDGEEFLVAASPSHIVLLAKLDKSEGASNGIANTVSSFNALVSRLSSDEAEKRTCISHNQERVGL